MRGRVLLSLGLLGIALAECGPSEQDGSPTEADLAPIATLPDAARRGLDLLVIADVRLVRRVRYSIRRAAFRAHGEHELTNPRLSLRIRSLPVADGYMLNLVGETDLGAECFAQRSFAIEEGVIEQLAVTLTCGAAGQVRKDERGDAQLRTPPAFARGQLCPTVTGVSILPIDTGLGKSLSVEGFTSSPTPTRWSVGYGGVFATPSSASTIFLCTSPGSHEIEFTTARIGCPATVQTEEIDCVAGPACGDGSLDADEECDDGNEVAGDGCGVGCIREPFCAAEFSCASTRTRAFCVGERHYRVARSARCDELCGGNECSGETCLPAGPLLSCPRDQRCVERVTGAGFDAECVRGGSSP